MRLKPHALFKREGDNLFCEMPVSFAMATLGGDLEVPTLDGRASIKIPPGSQSEKTFRLRGKGVKNVRGAGIGDLYCRVSVEVPVNLTSRQKELLEEFDKLVREGKARHSPRAQSWLDKIRELFG